MVELTNIPNQMKTLFSMVALAIGLGAPASFADLSKDELKKIHGKIQFVESFPDYKVKIVTSFPDLKVKSVSSFPDDPGEWQIVNSFPDFKIQLVDSFPDFTIQWVESFPGVP